jgi:hypothetical protein
LGQPSLRCLDSPEALESRGSESFQPKQLLAQHGAASPSQAIGAAAVLRREGLDPTVVLQLRQGRIERTRPHMHPSEGLNILEHRVAMFRAIRQARQEQEPGIGERA